MSLDASTLQVIVKGDGITATTEALDKLAKAGDRAERSAAKLAKSNKTADAAANASAKVWYDLVDKVSKAKEREYNALQRHNNKVYAAMQAEANKLNKLYDRQVAQDAANFAKRRAQEQAQLEALDTMRHRAAAKEYARAQAEATRMNALLDRQRKQAEAAAKASAERQRVLNSNYAGSSLAQQISTLQRAQSYAAQGGNVSQRFGSQVAGASSSGELQRLQQQYRQLQTDAARANRTMADTHAAVRGLSGSLGALWMTYGNLLPLISGAAIGAAIKGVIDVGSDIEHTLEKIRVLGQSTTGEIDQMRSTIMELGKGAQGPRDVAEALSVLTLAGLKASEALKAVQGTLSLAIAGDVSIEKAASTIVQVRTSLGYTADDFDHIADVIAKTAAVSMSSVDSISGAFLSAAAVGEVYGATLKDIGTGLAAVANLGIQGTAAGTTLKNFYADLAKGSEKSTSSLKAMGLTLRDLKDDNGAFINMLDLITKLDKGFDKLSKQARVEAMDRLFGERGIKTGAALVKMVNQVSTEVDHLTGKTYDNKLAEVFGEIEKSAAFATTAAIAMGQTTQNQMKSVGNTLQTSLGAAFGAIAPQIGEVARRLKAAFASPEFIAGIKFITTAIANLTLFVVEHAKQIGIMIAAYAGWKIGVFAAGLVTMAKSFDIAKIAARGFTAALGPLGLAITALGVAWELYAAQKNKAITDNDANANSLDEYAKGIEEAAKREANALQMRMRGLSEQEVMRKEQLENDKAASQKLIQQSAEGVLAMKKTMDEQWNALSTNQKKRAKLFIEGKVNSVDRLGTDDYVKQYAAYNKAADKHNKTVDAIKKNEASLFRDRAENAKRADAAAKALWSSKGFGTGELADPEAEKAAKKMAKFVANEALELAKLTAGYEAKNEAMKRTIALGKIAMADTQQAIVLENLLAGKYGADKTEGNKVYQKQKALALAADEAKAENERLKKVTEFANKLTELEAAQSEYNRTALDGSMAHFGALRKEAEGVIRLNSLNGEAAQSLRDRADAMDKYRRQQEDIVKLEKAADSAKARSDANRDEVDTMLAFGVAAKASAMKAAELYIQKMNLDTVGSQLAANMLREAAATEQLTDAYRDLVKEQLELELDLKEAQADALTLFGQNEVEKVRILADSQRKQAALRMADAQAAFDAKGAKGTLGLADVQQIMAAREAYEKTLDTINKIAGVKIGSLLQKEEVDRWRNLADVIQNGLTQAFGAAGEAAGKMFSLYAQGQAREIVVTQQIAGLRAASAKDGIDRTKEINRLQQDSSSARISEYAGMADAAKGFFDEQSKGYKLVDGISKALHVASMARAVAQTAAYVATAAAKFFAQSGWGGFAGVAAMGAVMAGLGYSMASGGSGGGMSAEDKQKVQGTGSVLGSATRVNGSKVELVGSKSESITKSLDILQKNSGLGLVKQDGLLRAMQNLSNSISKLATMVVRNSDLSGADIPEVKGTAARITEGIGSTLTFTKILDSFTNGFFSKISGKISNAVFGGNVSNRDVGFTIDKASIAEVLAGGVKAFQYADMKKDGGIFRSDKYWTDKKSVGADSNNQFSMVFESMYKTLQEAGKILGVAGDDFTKKLQSFVIDVGQISLKGLSGEQIEKELQAIFSKVGDQFAKFAFSDIQQYQKIGEGLLETVARVANELMQVRDVFTVLGKSLPGGMAAVTITQQIVEAFGGIETLTSGVGNYMQNILSEQQRLAITTKSVTEAMASLNLASVTTKDQFKAVVDSLDLTKAADIELFRNLMGLSAQFGQVADAADAAAKAEKERLENLLSQRLELEGRIAELTGDTAEATRVLAAQRAIELSKLDESLRPLQSRVWALEDEAAAADKAKEAADKLKELLKDMFDEAVSNAETAFGRLSKSVDAQKDIVNKFYDDAIEAAQKAGDAAKEAAQLQLEAAQKQRDSISSVLSMLDSTLNSTSVDSFDITKARRMEAQGYLQMAAIQASSGGSVANLGGLENALAAIAKPSEELFATFEDYARDQAGVQNVMERLRNTTQTQLSAAELTIKGINDTIEAIEKQTTDTIEQLEANRQSELSALDKIIENAQLQIDALKGIDNSVLSVSTAMMNFASQMAVANAMKSQAVAGGAVSPAPTPAGGAGGSLSLAQQVAGFYQNHLQRAPDLGGLDFFMGDLLSGKTTIDQVENLIKNSPEAQAIKNAPKFDIGTNFVPSDMFAMVHKGERIVPAADNRKLEQALSSDSKSSELDGLREEIRDLKNVIISGDVAKIQVMKEHLRLEKKWDQEGQPEIREVDYTAA